MSATALTLIGVLAAIAGWATLPDPVRRTLCGVGLVLLGCYLYALGTHSPTLFGIPLR